MSETVLNISDQQLIEFPLDIFNKHELEILLAYRCKLKHLSIYIQNLANLKKLDLSQNQLTELPDEITNLQNLGSLILYSNQLTQLPDLSNLGLVQLHLRDNQLPVFPLSILRIETLEELDLSFNYIDKLPDNIFALENLRVLSISDNFLDELPETICQMKNLERLNFNGNSIKKLPEGFRSLNLKTLDVSQNSWKEPLYEIGDIDSLVNLQYDGNMFEYNYDIDPLNAFKTLWKCRKIIAFEVICEVIRKYMNKEFYDRY